MISFLLLAVVAAGIFSAFVSANTQLKPQINAGYNLVRQTLESLYSEVKQSNWTDSSNELRPGDRTDPSSPSLDGQSYVRKRSVTALTKDNQSTEEKYRRAEVTVTTPADA